MYKLLKLSTDKYGIFTTNGCLVQIDTIERKIVKKGFLFFKEPVYEDDVAFTNRANKIFKKYRERVNHDIPM